MHRINCSSVYTYLVYFSCLIFKLTRKQRLVAEFLHSSHIQYDILCYSVILKVILGKDKIRISHKPTARCAHCIMSKILTSGATSNNHLKLKYVYRHFQNNIAFQCNVNINKVMAVWNKTKNGSDFWKITISLKNWHSLKDFRKQYNITLGQVLPISEVLCFTMITFLTKVDRLLSNHICAKVTVYR